MTTYYDEEDTTAIYDQMAKYIISLTTDDFELVKMFPFMISYNKINVTKDIKERVINNAPNYFSQIPDCQVSLNDRKRVLFNELKKRGKYTSTKVVCNHHDLHIAMVLLDSKILFEPYFTNTKYIKKLTYKWRLHDFSSFNTLLDHELAIKILDYYQSNVESINEQCAKNIIKYLSRTSSDCQHTYTSLVMYIVENVLSIYKLLDHDGFVDAKFQLFKKYGSEYFHKIMVAENIRSYAKYKRLVRNKTKPLIVDLMLNHVGKIDYEFVHDVDTVTLKCDNYMYNKFIETITN